MLDSAAIMKFEEGRMTNEEVVQLFSELVETGDVWKLGEDYVNAAAILIDSGKLKSDKRLN